MLKEQRDFATASKFYYRLIDIQVLAGQKNQVSPSLPPSLSIPNRSPSPNYIHISMNIYLSDTGWIDYDGWRRMLCSRS